MKNRQKHSAAFKAEVALEAMREQATVVEIGRRYKINPNLVHKWKKEAATRLATVFEPGRGDAESSADAERETELLRKIGQLTLENDFLGSRAFADGEARNDRSPTRPLRASAVRAFAAFAIGPLSADADC